MNLYRYCNWCDGDVTVDESDCCNTCGEPTWGSQDEYEDGKDDYTYDENDELDF